MSHRHRRLLAGLRPAATADERARRAGTGSVLDAAVVDQLSRSNLRRVVIVGALVLAVVATGGCSHRPQVKPGSLISDSGAVVDFRSMPTRTQVGMDPDGSAGYPDGAGAPPVPTTLVFPAGTVHRDFSTIQIGTNYAFAVDHDERHQPTHFEFFLIADNITQAKTMLREDADALGLSPDKVADITSQGISVEQGFVKGWLSAEVEARDAGNGDGSMTLIYSAAIGDYHNEAVDKVLHDGRMSLDLTTRPTAAALAFQDAYDSATINPEPHRQVILTLTTPRGRTSLPTDSLISERSSGTVTTTVLLGSTNLADGPKTVRSAAKAFGFDAEPALELISTASSTLQTRDQECASTDVYTCTIRVQTVDAGYPTGGFNYRITLTYR